MQLRDDQVTTAEVKDWKGLHLLHFHSSSCSQKVRTLLTEKGIAWESHPVDLRRHQNTTPWFLGINPRGVVPVLVHDGVVHVESNDILVYLDALPSERPSYLPQGEAERRIARESLDLEDSLHMALRTITMGFLVPGRMAGKPAQTLDAFESGGAPDPSRDKEVAWWRAFAENGGVTREQAVDATRAFRAAFETLDKRLADQPWLIGDRISVIEIAWFISVHRLAMAGYPMGRHPQLEALYQRLCERPAFAREIVPPLPIHAALRTYQIYRRATRTTLVDTIGDDA